MGTGTTSPAEAGKSAEERCEAPSSSQHYAHPLYTTQNNTHTHTTYVYRPFAQDYPGKPVQKGKTHLDCTEERQRVASAGPYASLHLAPDR